MERITNRIAIIKSLLVCFLISAAFCVRAAEKHEFSQLEAAQELYLKGDHESAFVLYEGMAAKGMPEAIYYLGVLSAKKGDFNRSIKYYRQAAEKAYVPAIRQLGYSHFSGEGVESDQLTAMDWLRRAAAVERKQPSKNKPIFLTEKQGRLEETPTSKVVDGWVQRAKAGEVEAQYRLAKIYDDGFLTGRSMARAVEWYTAAAKNGHQGSQFLLGYLYCRGTEVEKNIELADEWLKRSNRGVTCNIEQGKQDEL